MKLLFRRDFPFVFTSCSIFVFNVFVHTDTVDDKTQDKIYIYINENGTIFLWLFRRKYNTTFYLVCNVVWSIRCDTSDEIQFHEIWYRYKSNEFYEIKTNNNDCNRKVLLIWDEEAEWFFVKRDILYCTEE